MTKVVLFPKSRVSSLFNLGVSRDCERCSPPARPSGHAGEHLNDATQEDCVLALALLVNLKIISH